MTQEKFLTDFQYYTNLILSNQPFAYARYADGEVRLMRGLEVGTNTQAYALDKWTSESGMNAVGEMLLNTLNHVEHNYHYAISGVSDSVDDYTFLTERIKNTNLTFANLWINANYKKMKAFYSSIKHEVYVVSNYKSRLDLFPFKVAEHFAFPDDCVAFFNTPLGENYIQQLTAYSSGVNGKTFFISAGPVSEILIHEMYLRNPNNQYIDVGSSLDEYTHGRKTRPYMHDGSVYANEVSHF